MSTKQTSTRQNEKGLYSTRHTVQICMGWKLSITRTLLCVSTPALHVLTCKSLHTSSTSTQLAPPFLKGRKTDVFTGFYLK